MCIRDRDTFVAKIVDLNEHIPPDPVATDTNPGYSVPSLPNETQKLTANWGVWSCYWVPVWAVSYTHLDVYKRQPPSLPVTLPGTGSVMPMSVFP